MILLNYNVAIRVKKCYGTCQVYYANGIFKPKIKICCKKVKNLFLQGNLTVPGPGWPPALISGKIATDLIIKTLKQWNRFLTMSLKCCSKNWWLKASSTSVVTLATKMFVAENTLSIYNILWFCSFWPMKLLTLSWVWQENELLLKFELNIMNQTCWY